MDVMVEKVVVVVVCSNVMAPYQKALLKVGKLEVDDDREVSTGIVALNANEDCMTAGDHSPLLHVADDG